MHLDLHAPSAYHDASGQLRGMDVELVSAIMQAAGCQIRWHVTPMTGARIVKSLQDGEIDLMIRASKNPDRERFACFSQPYRQEVVGLFARTRSDLPDELGLADALRLGLRMIGPASGWYGIEFEQYRNRFKQQKRYTAYPDAQVGTELLFATPSRGDLVLIDADLFYHFVGPDRIMDIRLASPQLHVTPAHLMASQQTVNLATMAALNKAIRRLQQSGELQRLEQSYRPKVLSEQLAKQAKLGATPTIR
ncbi:transporter substrate-binding domain-containing protein [Rheinheimera texasensis]|uniref:substrate-binding periplasmic protein n=1 Tax=Rheinheimera texasensis TaxID=306205 RepID=UPI0032B13C34